MARFWVKNAPKPNFHESFPMNHFIPLPLAEIIRTQLHEKKNSIAFQQSFFR